MSQPVPQVDTWEWTQSFEDLVAAEHSGLFGALCMITGDRLEAEDIMQDAFHKLWEHWDRVKDMDDPKGYLYRAALNLHRKRVRRTGVAIRRALRPTPAVLSVTPKGVGR